MSIPYSLRIKSATALRVHNGEAMPTSSGVFSLRIVRRHAAWPSLRVRPEPTGRPVRSPGRASMPSSAYAVHHRETVSRASPSNSATSVSV